VEILLIFDIGLSVNITYVIAKGVPFFQFFLAFPLAFFQAIC
jgi:hypothetical protein